MRQTSFACSAIWDSYNGETKTGVYIMPKSKLPSRQKILAFHKQRFPKLQVFSNAYLGRDYQITFTQPEYTSVCPMTGLPDFGVITIEYVPDKWCLELKAFKYYLLAYRNAGIFYEMAVNKILDDLVKACRPRYMQVRGDFTARGGIATTVKAEYRSKERSFS